jgi:hypothetical protein
MENLDAKDVAGLGPSCRKGRTLNMGLLAHEPRDASVSVG